MLPTQIILLLVATEKVAGCVIVVEIETEQRFASLTVQEYVPATKPDAVAALPPVGVQE